MKKYLDLLTDSVRRGWTHLDDVTDLHCFNYLKKTLTAPQPTSFSRTLTIRAVADILEISYPEAKKKLYDFPQFRLGEIGKWPVLYSREVLDYIV